MSALFASRNRRFDADFFSGYMALAGHLRANLAKAAIGSNEEPREMHSSRVECLASYRLAALLDPDLTLAETGVAAPPYLYQGEVPGGEEPSGITQQRPAYQSRYPMRDRRGVRAGPLPTVRTAKEVE